MVIICQKCGDRGFDVALIYCDECQAYAVHRYCLDVLPATFDEFVAWLCNNCESKAVKLTSLDKPNSPISLESDCESLKIIQLKKRIPLKRSEGKSMGKIVDCTLTNPDLLRPQISSYFQLVEVLYGEDDGKYQKLGNQNGFHKDIVFDVAECLESKNSVSSKPDLQRVDIDCCQNSDKDQGLGGQNSLEDSSFHEESESLKNKNSHLCDVQPLQIHCCKDGEKSQKAGGQNDLNEGSFVEEDGLDRSKNCQRDAPYFAEQSSIHVLPIRDPIWRGSISIFQKNYGAPGGIVAHLSSIACSRVSEEAKGLPRLLSPELLPRSAAWPKSFQNWGPTADHLGLYFFPDNERNEIVFDSLVNDMISQDLAMRVVFERSELLIYNSNILPMDCWRFQSKFYLWGVFRPRKPLAVGIDVVSGEEQGITKVITEKAESC